VFHFLSPFSLLALDRSRIPTWLASWDTSDTSISVRIFQFAGRETRSPIVAPVSRGVLRLRRDFQSLPVEASHLSQRLISRVSTSGQHVFHKILQGVGYLDAPERKRASSRGRCAAILNFSELQSSDDWPGIEPIESLINIKLYEDARDGCARGIKRDAAKSRAQNFTAKFDSIIRATRGYNYNRLRTRFTRFRSLISFSRSTRTSRSFVR